MYGNPSPSVGFHPNCHHCGKQAHLLTWLHANNGVPYDGSDSQNRSASGQCRKSPPHRSPRMSVPKTMFQLSGRGYAAANLSHATLVIIDAQKEYLSGPLALSGMDAAVGNIKQLVSAARNAGRPIVHVRHLGTVGGLFDPQGERGEFIPALSLKATKPSSASCCPAPFTAQAGKKTLAGPRSLDLIVCGFMSHSSVSTTVRAAKNLGFRCTLVEDACATRDLPYKGGILSAEHVQQTEMAIMADNFATLALTKI
ncbi:isochorismatase family domain-containing protein [Ditylenchus destructor]|nr:isochorismatase family domain-containing protein [Ditylenchus destructor]